MKRNGAEIHLWKNIGVDKLMARFGYGSGAPAGASSGRSAPQSPAQVSGQSSGQSSGRSIDGSASTEVIDGPASDDLEKPPRPVTTVGDGRARAAKATMTREQALKTLGLAPGATAAQVEAAYKARARQKGGLNGSARLNQARDVLRGEST
jgi:hypothetical protein